MNIEMKSKTKLRRRKNTFTAAPITGHIVSDGTGTTIATRGVNTSM